MNVAQRITLVISSLGGGGAERVAVDLCAALASAGRNVAVLTLSGNDPDAHELPPAIPRDRIDIRYSPKNKFESLKFTLINLLKMRRSILAQKPDVVISFIDQTNIRTIGCLAGTGIPVVVSERVHPGHHPVTRSWGFLRRLVYRFADAVVVQADDIADWFRKNVPTRKLVTIPNAVRSSAFVGCASPDLAREKIILGIGRLARQKGFDLLLRAFAMSGLANEGWRVVILGEGAERQALTALSDELEISGSIEMRGHVTNVSEWMSRSSLFALSSRYEGFPNALLEAMQLGMACISFDCPSGPRILINDGSNGILVPAEDITGLCEGLRKLAQGKALRELLSKAAIKVSERFSANTVYGLWMKVADSALPSFPPK
jgi:GalNAc-alpha-(1->4)-GalNAc-alpha-(1->3)-diNAcBac-PP-undecaprenol alpha-1,4-N-acetyl-D-galactosaminyltransferase